MFFTALPRSVPGIINTRAYRFERLPTIRSRLDRDRHRRIVILGYPVDRSEHVIEFFASRSIRGQRRASIVDTVVCRE